jgi:mannose-6-phosphate isomerase-like protein (cupin superfamily)
MSRDAVFDLSRFPVHLGLGARVTRQPEHTGDPAWNEAYWQRTAADGLEGRLVAIHSFAEPWKFWEVHPKGDELVVCLAGHIVLHQEIDGVVRTFTLERNQAVINPPGAWHTADVTSAATALFITAGTGTQHRPR